jgi:short subunit dehydrogenase-like uncharacterized protein
MSNKQFDITVFGATGLTGKQIVRHLYQLSQEHPSLYPSQFKWAIAGRSEDKLQAIVNEIVSEYPETTLSKPTILAAAVTQRDKLDVITSQSKVLINAVGPFRFMGEYVVRSCVEQECDYVDVTGK